MREHIVIAHSTDGSLVSGAGTSKHIRAFKDKFIGHGKTNLTPEQEAILLSHVNGRDGAWSEGWATAVRWDETQKAIFVGTGPGGIRGIYS